MARRLYGDVSDDMWAVLLKEWRANPNIWDRVQDAFDQADAAIALALRFAAEQCSDYATTAGIVDAENWAAGTTPPEVSAAQHAADELHALFDELADTIASSAERGAAEGK